MNETIIKKLINDYKKANLVRREKMALASGFKTGGEYLKYLEDSLPKADCNPESIKATEVEKPAKTKKASKKREVTPVDMVIAFDTTGSMSSYIKDVRKHVKSLVEDLFNKTENLQIKIVAFGDYFDMSSSTNFGIAYQQIELTNDKNALIEFVNNAKNTNGGDWEEFYELVIKKITEETNWRGGSEKSVLLIADANPHHIGYSYSGIVQNAQLDWKEEAKKSAELKIKWDTLTISSTWFKELSTITGGISLPFRNAEKMSQVVEAVTYARSASTSEVSKEAFMTKSAVVMDSGDEELIGVYKSLSTLL